MFPSNKRLAVAIACVDKGMSGLQAVRQ